MLQSKCMKVVLISNVKKLGLKGEIVDVADGYAENFLYTQNLAVQATPQVIAKLEQQKQNRVRKNEKDLVGAQKTAEKLEGSEIVITEKVNDEGVLYAAVTGKVIAEYLKNNGHEEITEKMIKLRSPIKETGEYKCRIELPHKLEADLQVVIEATK